jgi:hypothetical protein
MSQEVEQYQQPNQQLATMNAEQVRDRVNLIQRVMKGVMKNGVHYGTIPGCGDKPALLKPGAETLAVAFRLAIEPVVFDLSTPDECHFRVETRMLSQADGSYLGSGIGEASSNEEKYHWRRATCDEEYEETDESRKRNVWKRGKGGKGYQIKQVRTNPADVANTVLKMAKKRSQVDGTLSVTGASDIFSQDIEDLPEGLREQVASSDGVAAAAIPTIGPSSITMLAKEMDRVGLTEAQVKKNLAAKAKFKGELTDMPFPVWEALMAGLSQMATKAPKEEPKPADEAPVEPDEASQVIVDENGEVIDFGGEEAEQG